MTNSKLNKIQDNYVDVEKHLFKSNKTFIEYLQSIISDDEMLEYFNVTNKEIEMFIMDISSIETNVTKNTIVKIVNRDNYTVIIYALKPTQSYSKHESIAKCDLRTNTTIDTKCFYRVLGGVLEQNNNRVYLLLKD